MYESETNHLYSSFKECSVCGKPLKEKYRTKGRTIKSLKGRIDIVTHVYACVNFECSKYDVSIYPEEETLLAIKGYKFGLDVIVKIGHLRYFEHKTWVEVHKILTNDYDLKISLREIGYLEQSYLALVNIVAKEDIELLKRLENLSGLILAIDGIKPDNSNEILYLIREVQTGQILVAEILTESNNLKIQELLQKVIDLRLPILGIVSDKQESIRLAIEKKLPDIPHQLCYYHYLKNLALPIAEEDSKLKKNISKGLEKNVREVEKKLESEETKEQMPEQDIEAVKNYCLAIKTWLKKSPYILLNPQA